MQTQHNTIGTLHREPSYPTRRLAPFSLGLGDLRKQVRHYQQVAGCDGVPFKFKKLWKPRIQEYAIYVCYADDKPDNRVSPSPEAKEYIDKCVKAWISEFGSDFGCVKGKYYYAGIQTAGWV